MSVHFGLVGVTLYASEVALPEDRLDDGAVAVQELSVMGLAPSAKPQLFLTPHEVSKQLGLSLGELRQLRGAGGGPRFAAITTRSILYFASDVATWSANSS